MQRAALFQQDVEAVEEVVQGPPHHPQNVPVLFITHVEKLLAERYSQSIHLDSCRIHEGAALKMDSFFKPSIRSDSALPFLEEYMFIIFTKCSGSSLQCWYSVQQTNGLDRQHISTPHAFSLLSRSTMKHKKVALSHRLNEWHLHKIQMQR